MKVLIFSVLLALCVAFVRAGGDAYEITHYGGSNDKNRQRNPSCFDNLKEPPTPLYAAVSTSYKRTICENYAVVMGVSTDGSSNVGKMVKVQIVDSCHECERSHIDVSEEAFEYVGKKGAGHFTIIWVAADKNGNVNRDVIYPSSQTEKFAKEKFGLSKDRFVSMFKKQALDMIKKDIRHASFNKEDAPRTTTTRKTTTTTRKTTTTTTTTMKTTQAPTTTQSPTVAEDPTVTETTAVVTAVETAPAAIGEVDIVLEESNEKTIPKDAPIVGKSKKLDPNQVDYTPEEIKILESQFPDKENKGGSYKIGILTGSTFIGCAAGIGLLYLKKKNPNKYEELKQKFPEAFTTLKRNVTRSASSIRRGVNRTATSIRRKNNKTEESRHGDHEGYNYREMPEHMFGEDGLPRIKLLDEPVKKDYPEATIEVNLKDN